MKKTLLALAIAGLFVAGPVQAQSAADVAKAKGCGNCHELDKKKMGLSYKDIAAKYKDDKSAEDKLAAKLKDGKGHMKVAAPDAELKSAVQYVLSAK